MRHVTAAGRATFLPGPAGRNDRVNPKAAFVGSPAPPPCPERIGVLTANRKRICGVSIATAAGVPAANLPRQSEPTNFVAHYGSTSSLGEAARRPASLR